MRQISAQWNMFSKKVVRASIMSNNFDVILSRFIFLSFGALAICYVLILGNMVANIIERRSLEISSRTLQSEVGDLELRYLELSNGIDLPLAHSLGFKETKASYATRKTFGFKPIDNVSASQNGI